MTYVILEEDHSRRFRIDADNLRELYPREYADFIQTYQGRDPSADWVKNVWEEAGIIAPDFELLSEDIAAHAYLEEVTDVIGEF